MNFIKCSASSDGGAIYVFGTPVNFSGTNIFTANRTVPFRERLYEPNSSRYITFTANSAGSKGGGIYVQLTNITFSGTGNFSGNMAQLDGGGIYIESSKVILSGNITVRNNTAQQGGGVYSDNNIFIVYGHEVVEGNFAT